MKAMQIAYKMENKNNYANILVQLDYEIIFENMGRLDIKDFFFEVGWKIKDDFAQSALQTPLR